EIEDVYVRGPSSCMSDNESHYDSGMHPVRVYGAGDLAVVYIEGKDSDGDTQIIARALVWPARRTASQIYPTPDAWQEDFTCRAEAENAKAELTARLRKLGYALPGEHRGGLNGARLLLIWDQGGDQDGDGDGDDDDSRSNVVMPYLDGSYGFQTCVEDSSFLALHSDGEWAGGNTNGIARYNGEPIAHCQ